MIAGPDGTGKSTLSSTLAEAVFEGVWVLHLHHRFGILPRRENRDVDITRPQEQHPYAPPLSWAKCLYLFADYQLGWLIRARPFVKAGGWVVLERGWWDIAVDQRRYRLRSSGWLLRLAGRLLPRPDLVIVLTAPVQTLLSRKAELSPAEFERQLKLWRRVLPVGVVRVFVDASESRDAVAESAREALRRIAPSLLAGGTDRRH